MLSHGQVNHVQVSSSTYDLTKNSFNFEDRGKINIKGKNCFIWKNRKFTK